MTSVPFCQAHAGCSVMSSHLLIHKDSGALTFLCLYHYENVCSALDVLDHYDVVVFAAVITSVEEDTPVVKDLSFTENLDNYPIATNCDYCQRDVWCRWIYNDTTPILSICRKCEAAHIA